MKHKIVSVIILVLALTGCGNNNSKNTVTNNKNSVENVINDQISNSVEDNTENDDLDKLINVQEKTETEINSNVDYDLTVMNSDMVYATVYQMIVDPETYVGKTFRINGIYYSAYYEPTNEYCHYCVIQDATACCAQGLEFIWGNGSHIYPDEYPKDTTEIIVEGTFEIYQEKSDSKKYCRLQNSTLEIKNN